MSEAQVGLLVVYVLSSIFWTGLLLWLLVSGRIIDLFEFLNRLMNRRNRQ